MSDETTTEVTPEVLPAEERPTIIKKPAARGKALIPIMIDYLHQVAGKLTSDTRAVYTHNRPLRPRSDGEKGFERAGDEVITIQITIPRTDGDIVNG